MDKKSVLNRLYWDAVKGGYINYLDSIKGSNCGMTVRDLVVSIMGYYDLKFSKKASLTVFRLRLMGLVQVVRMNNKRDKVYALTPSGRRRVEYKGWTGQ